MPAASHPLRFIVTGLSIGGVDGEILRGFNLYRRSMGRATTLWDAGHDHSGLEHYLGRAEAADGILANISDAAIRDRLRRKKIPVVDCASVLEERPFPRVTSDNRAVGRMAGESYSDRPYATRLYVSSNHRVFERYRWEGFRAAAEADGGSPPEWWQLDPRAEVVADKGKGKGKGKDKNSPLPRRIAHLAEALRECPRPIALFAATDRVGMSVCDAARVAGLNIPRDLRVLAVDDVEVICEACDPPLSSIQLPGRQIGFEAGRRLHRAIEGERQADATLLPPQMIHVRTSTDPGVGDTPAARAIRFMREHLGESLQVQDIAAALHLHPRTFLRQFKKETGHNPHEELLRLRIEAARRILLLDDRPIYEISEACGFGDPDQFGRHFRKATGMTPTQFRTGNSGE